uniref:Uncharacterized protein n=1 Tax=Solanum lycopersicum TaxID=4081 RepID=A0A3Q7GFF4_SOLLC
MRRTVGSTGCPELASKDIILRPNEEISDIRCKGTPIELSISRRLSLEHQS